MTPTIHMGLDFGVETAADRRAKGRVGLVDNLRYL